VLDNQKPRHDEIKEFVNKVVRDVNSVDFNQKQKQVEEELNIFIQE